METIKGFVKSNLRQLCEIGILVVAAALPHILNFNELLKEYYIAHPISPENFHWYLLNHDDLIASFVCMIVFLIPIRKWNQNYTMNHKPVYHDYPYFWYWISAKILGINKCNLILVPIKMQFKLIINDTFLEYPFDGNDCPVIENEVDPSVSKWNTNESGREINLILEDTYQIALNQLPREKKNLFTIKVSRYSNEYTGRHYSVKFVDAAYKVVKDLTTGVTVNIYATTNPQNTYYLAKRVFTQGSRGEITHLYVFQQNHTGSRSFQHKGYRIY